jgi:hypothetical protein
MACLTIPELRRDASELKDARHSESFADWAQLAPAKALWKLHWACSAAIRARKPAEDASFHAEVARRFREARVAAGLSTAEAAHRAWLTEATVRRSERTGRSQVETIAALVRVYGVSVDWLFQIAEA